MKNLNSKHITNLAEIQKALDLRQEGTAQPWVYRVSLQWLTIRITTPGVAGNFHLECGSCERVVFDTWWQCRNIRIEKTADGFRIQDGEHLIVDCGLVVGAYNVAPVFGMQ
jgi:hypothetical protein